MLDFQSVRFIKYAIGSDPRVVDTFTADRRVLEQEEYFQWLQDMKKRTDNIAKHLTNLISRSDEETGSYPTGGNDKVTRIQTKRLGFAGLVHTARSMYCRNKIESVDTDELHRVTQTITGECEIFEQLEASLLKIKPSLVTLEEVNLSSLQETLNKSIQQHKKIFEDRKRLARLNAEKEHYIPKVGRLQKDLNPTRSPKKLIRNEEKCKKVQDEIDQLSQELNSQLNMLCQSRGSEIQSIVALMASLELGMAGTMYNAVLPFQSALNQFVNPLKEKNATILALPEPDSPHDVDFKNPESQSFDDCISPPSSEH